MSDVETVEIPAAAWLEEMTHLREGGLAMLDVLAAVDRIEEIEVVVHLLDAQSGRRVLASTRLPAVDAQVASLADVFPGASWHEREASEMLGITFVGHPDPRRLLLHSTPDVPPLLKAAPLPARLANAWPGAAEADAGRRARRPQLPPGVRPEWVREES